MGFKYALHFLVQSLISYSYYKSKLCGFLSPVKKTLDFVVSVNCEHNTALTHPALMQRLLPHAHVF